MTLICAKFGKDLFSISKVIGHKTKWPRFFGLPCRPIQHVQMNSYTSHVQRTYHSPRDSSNSSPQMTVRCDIVQTAKPAMPTSMDRTYQIKSNQIIYLSQATWPIHRHSHTRTQYTIIQKKENKKKLK